MRKDRAQPGGAMGDKAFQPSGSNERTLQSLFRAIASGDSREASRLLAASPALAMQAATCGASRGGASAYFFEEIRHYAYAGDTPLHLAAAAYQRQIAGKLVSRGARVGARNRRGAEPLHYAADGIPGSLAWDPAEQAAMIDFLIQAGADPKSVDQSGVAPLHRAVRTRCSAAVRALLRNGADARQKNRSGSTPLHLAVQGTGRGGTGSRLAREEQVKIVRLLLEHGARPSDRDARGKTVTACVNAEWIHDIFTRVD